MARNDISSIPGFRALDGFDENETTSCEKIFQFYRSSGGSGIEFKVRFYQRFLDKFKQIINQHRRESKTRLQFKQPKSNKIIHQLEFLLSAIDDIPYYNIWDCRVAKFVELLNNSQMTTVNVSQMIEGSPLPADIIDASFIKSMIVV